MRVVPQGRIPAVFGNRLAHLLKPLLSVFTIEIDDRERVINDGAMRREKALDSRHDKLANHLERIQILRKCAVRVSPA